jgi:hypothetical protein
VPHRGIGLDPRDGITDMMEVDPVWIQICEDKSSALDRHSLAQDGGSQVGT